MATQLIARPVKLATTNPTLANNTNVVVATANSDRRALVLKNNHASADILISLSGATLTSATPSNTNPGFLLKAGESYENPAHFCPVSDITAYQSSGGSIASLSVGVA